MLKTRDKFYDSILLLNSDTAKKHIRHICHTEFVPR